MIDVPCMIWRIRQKTLISNTHFLKKDLIHQAAKLILIQECFYIQTGPEKRMIFGSEEKETIYVHNPNLLPMADQSRNWKQTLKCNQQCVFKMNWEVNTSWQVDKTWVLCSGPTSLYIHEATVDPKSTWDLNSIELLSLLQLPINQVDQSIHQLSTSPWLPEVPEGQDNLVWSPEWC